jgi:hypothetical protein
VPVGTVMEAGLNEVPLFNVTTFGLLPPVFPPLLVPPLLPPGATLYPPEPPPHAANTNATIDAANNRECRIVPPDTVRRTEFGADVLI